MFNFVFEKTSDEVKEKAGSKIKALTAKNAERQQRIAKLREEHGIDDSALIQLLQAARQQERANSYSYTSNAIVGGQNKMEEKTIGAGVVNHLLTENDFIETDKATIKKLDTLVRNLRPLPRITSNGNNYKADSYQLSYDELEFLGF
jgi:hypothetical protein